MRGKETIIIIVAAACIFAAACIIATSIRKPRGFHPTVTSPALTAPSTPMSILAPMEVGKLKPINQPGDAKPVK
ncbi:MAG: hypothetical protein RMK18_02140 [Armatimonadota bacterium]|nr:hypothetical protein [Armatimonadota bacterium]MCX7777242.1 hypothetical protein [Armatimonadota bacterium]MDW8024657.1 hypothetical protein [Armatimonadota bacterium]